MQHERKEKRGRKQQKQRITFYILTVNFNEHEFGYIEKKVAT